jgi:hypothetical protein
MEGDPIMPFAWIDNPVAVTRKGIKIYHIFKEDHEDCGIRTYWFGLSTYSSDDGGEDTFDVRELPNWTDSESVLTEDYHIKSVLRKAIDLGIIYKKGDEVKIKKTRKGKRS